MIFFRIMRVLFKYAKNWIMDQLSHLIEPAVQQGINHSRQRAIPIWACRTRKEKLVHQRQPAESVDVGLYGVSLYLATLYYHTLHYEKTNSLQLHNHQTCNKHLPDFFFHSDISITKIRLHNGFHYHNQICLNGCELLRSSFQKQQIASFLAQRNKSLHTVVLRIKMAIINSYLSTAFRYQQGSSFKELESHISLQKGYVEFLFSAKHNRFFCQLLASGVIPKLPKQNRYILLPKTIQLMSIVNAFPTVLTEECMKLAA